MKLPIVPPARPRAESRGAAFVHATKKVPSWYRSVGANSTKSPGPPSGRSWSGRVAACPISSQCTRSVECRIGMPGQKSKVLVARKKSAPTRHTDGSGATPRTTGLVNLAMRMHELDRTPHDRGHVLGPVPEVRGIRDELQLDVRTRRPERLGEPDALRRRHHVVGVPVHQQDR